MTEYVVTEAKKFSPALAKVARAWAQDLGLAYVVRESMGDAKEYLLKHALKGIIVSSTQGPLLVTATGSMHYHPGMAVLRLKELVRGGKDNFATACGLTAGMRILDCTCGLGADSIIASHICGQAGEVVSLEASLPIYFLTHYGFTHYQAEQIELTQAMRRIKLVHSTAQEYLAQTTEQFAVIYFDPMFHWPVETSVNMTPLRPVAYGESLTRETIELALRHTKCVVVKERDIRYLKALGATEIAGGRYSRVKYGIVRGDEG